MAVLRVGVGIAAAGTLLAVTLLILRSRVLAGTIGTDEVTNEEVRDAVRGLLDAYLGDLISWGLLLALLGVVTAAAAAALDPGDVEAPARRLARRVLDRPQTVAGRTLRGAAALALGVGIVLAPTLALQVTAIAGGVYLVFFGVTELLATRRYVPSVSPGATGRSPWRQFRRRAATAPRRCATGSSTRSPSPAPTTRSRRPTVRAGTSPTSCARSRASSTMASASS